MKKAMSSSPSSAVFKQLDSVCRALCSSPNRLYGTDVQYVYDNWQALLERWETIQDLLAQRQALIELHFLHVPMPLFVHEHYHEVSARLQKEMRSFFGDAKTLLNDFTRLVFFLIPEKKRRGITLKSFGSCVNACILNLDKAAADAASIFRLYVEDGDRLKKSICDYRDDFVEHSKSLTHGHLVTGPYEARLVHYAHTRPLTGIISNLDSCYLSDILIIRCATPCHGTLAFVHLQPDVQVHDAVHSGQYLGHLHDSSGVHFQKHGEHMHIFPPCSEEAPQLPAVGKVIGNSPDIFVAMDDLSRFLLKGFTELRAFVEQTDRQS